MKCVYKWNTYYEREVAIFFSIYMVTNLFKDQKHFDTDFNKSFRQVLITANLRKVKQNNITTKTYR